jgi:hypothetical protein
MNCPYRRIASERWPSLEVNGMGRWALVAHKDGTPIAVYLTDNREAALASQPFYDSKVIDLSPRSPSIRETAEDRYESRLREKRGL